MTRAIRAEPAVSVIMPARNEIAYIDDAIASVLAQGFTDFELLIHDDASSDGTGEALARWAGRDDRIRLHRSPTPLGVAIACNRMIAQAHAPILARMDADDIAAPYWLERLYPVLVQDADIVLVGCLMSGMDAAGRLVRGVNRQRLTHPSVFPPFGHGSALFRKAAFDRIGGYRPQCTYWEDFDLTLRLACEGAMVVVPEDLCRYRFAATSTRLVADQTQVERAVVTMLACANAYQATGDYEAVLAAGVADVEHSPYLPRALSALASNRLWNAVRPGKWRRIARAVARRPTPGGLVLLAYASWSQLSPRTLRAVLSALIARQSREAAARGGDAPMRWHPCVQPVPYDPPAQAATRALVMAACHPAGRAIDLPGHAPIDGGQLVRSAAWHRVDSFVHAAARRVADAIPADAMQALAMADRRNRLSALAHAGEEARLARAAQADGLDMLFVKGATLAHLVHSDPMMKTSWDIDVLIAPADLPNARRFLEAQGYFLELPPGVEPGPRLDRWLAANRESLWRNASRGTVVELHTALCESPALLRGVGMTSPRQTVAMLGTPVPTFATPELFAYLAVHGTMHRWARLKWLADIAALLRSSELSIEQMYEAAVGRGAGYCPGVALLLCERLFDMPLPDALAGRLAADRGVRRLVAHSLRAIAAEGGPHRTLAAITLGDHVAGARLQYWLKPGLPYRWRTFWSQWNRPYAASQLGIPSVLFPLAMIAWLPIRLLTRRLRAT